MINDDYNITAPETARFLHLNGWLKENQNNPNLLKYKSPENLTDDDGNSVYLVIPNGYGYEDEQKRINSVINTLSALYKISPELMAYKLKNQGVDVLNQRFISPSNSYGMPLEYMPSIMKYLRDLIYYSACSEAFPDEKYFSSRKSVGKKYTEKCRFAQTFKGSFGLRIEMPMPINSDTKTQSLFEEIPMERRIMKRIAKGIMYAKKGVSEGNTDIITQNYKTAFNANLCDTFAELTGMLSDFEIGYLLDWSSEYQIEEEFKTEECIIDARIYSQYFESAAKSLKTSYIPRKMTISGKISHLSATTKENDEDPELPIMSEQRIVIDWKNENGELKKIHVGLSKEDYARACDAHKNGQTVRINGIPKKEGKIMLLNQPSDFSVMPYQESLPSL